MNQITVSPVIINVAGANKVDRQLSVISHASSAALTACLDLKGKAGNAIRSASAHHGLTSVADQAFKGNFKPLAEMLAIRMGEPVVISSKSAFWALPDMFTARKLKAETGKNGGMREDKKSGVLIPGSGLRAAQELLDLVLSVTDAVREALDAAKAEREADKTNEAAEKLTNS